VRLPTVSPLRSVRRAVERSLRARTFIPIAVLSTSALVLMIVVSVVSYTRDLRREQESRALLFSSLAASSVQAFAGQFRHDDFTAVLADLARHRPDVEELALVNPDGTVGAASSPFRVGDRAWRPDQRPPDHQPLPIPGHGIRVLMPVENTQRCGACHGSQSRAVAWLEVHFNGQGLEDARRHLTLTLTLAALPSLALLLGVAWLLLGYDAVKPIQRLVAAMRRAEAGGKLVHADEGRPDEIGEAARRFDGTLAALRASQAELEQTYEERMVRADRLAIVGQMATGLAHEIRNPLAGLSGALELLAEDFQDQPQRAEVLAEMRHQVERLSRIMNALLSFARPPRAQLQPADVNTALQNVLFLVGRQRHAASVRIEPNLAEGLPKVHADPAQIEQVFLNICLNAARAIDGKGGTISVASRLRDAEVVVEISDTGPGIPEVIRPNIFTPFFTTHSNGTGLGLAISNRIVTEHGGRIWFQCPPSGGTTFVVTLPVEGRPAAEPGP